MIHKSLWVCACCRYQISETNLRSTDWLHWYSHRNPTRGLRKTQRGSDGGDVGIHSSQSTSCSQYWTGTFCRMKVCCTEPVEVSEFGADCNESTQSIGAYLSSHAKRETGAHNRWFSGEWSYTIRASGWGATIPLKVDDGVIEYLCFFWAHINCPIILDIDAFNHIMLNWKCFHILFYETDYA